MQVNYLLINGISFLLAFLFSFTLMPIIRKYGNGNGYVDLPDARKVHGIAKPRLGGVAIYTAFTLSVIILLFQDININDKNALLGLLLGNGLIFSIGLYDDLKGAGAYQKLSVQIFASILLYYFGFRISTITNPFGTDLSLGWLSMPVTVLWIVGITNAINLIDGIDELAAGVSIIICLTLTGISIYLHNYLVLFLAVALGGAVLGFFPYNRNPASIFMGDSGSLFIGNTIACLAVWGSQRSRVSLSILVPVIALGLPIIDTLLAITRRFIKKTPIFVADKEHCHHKLLEKGYSHKEVINILYFLCAFFSIAAVSIAMVSSVGAFLILVLVIAVTLAFINTLGYVNVSDLHVSNQVRPYGNFFRSRGFSPVNRPRHGAKAPTP